MAYIFQKTLSTMSLFKKPEKKEKGKMSVT